MPATDRDVSSLRTRLVWGLVEQVEEWLVDAEGAKGVAWDVLCRKYRADGRGQIFRSTNDVNAKIIVVAGGKVTLGTAGKKMAGRL